MSLRASLAVGDVLLDLERKVFVERRKTHLINDVEEAVIKPRVPGFAFIQPEGFKRSGGVKAKSHAHGDIFIRGMLNVFAADLKFSLLHGEFFLDFFFPVLF